MNKHVLSLVAATAACLCIGAQAADDTTATSSMAASVPLTSGQAAMAKIQNKADYKASKKEADARLDRAKADCIANTDASQSACRKAAKAGAKKEKADAKVTEEANKMDIKANTK